MKKRRELDALVSKPSSRSSKAKNGNHELLRNDSYSSEGEEFVLPEKMASTNKSRPHYCLMCLLIFGIIMLLSCFGIMGGLLWMLIQVKTEVQDLKLQISQVESSTSQKMKDFILKEIETNSELINLKMKNLELTKVAGSILLLQEEVAFLQNLTNSLSSSSLTLTMANQMKDLYKTIADDRSSMNVLKDDITELKKYKLEIQESFKNVQEKVNMKPNNEMKKILDSFEKKVEASRNNVTDEANILKTEIFGIFDVVNALNSSLSSLANRTSSLEAKLEAEKNHLLQNKTGMSGSSKNYEQVKIKKIDKDSVASTSEDVLTSSPSFYSSASTFVNVKNRNRN